MNHFIELEEKGLINHSSRGGVVSITSKDREFIKQYDELINLIETACL
jgi:predicted transcriptional regulator